MSFRNGKDHCVFGCPGIELCRAHKITDIFEHNEIEVIHAHLFKSLTAHIRIKVTHSAGMQLDDLFDAGIGNAFGVNIGIDIGFHDADIHLPA